MKRRKRFVPGETLGTRRGLIYASVDETPSGKLWGLTTYIGIYIFSLGQAFPVGCGRYNIIKYREISYRQIHFASPCISLMLVVSPPIQQLHYSYPLSIIEHLPKLSLMLPPLFFPVQILSEGTRACAL